MGLRRSVRPTEPAGPRPTRIEAWLERRFPAYGFGVVFLLLLATYVLMAASPPHAWARVITVILEGVITRPGRRSA